MYNLTASLNACEGILKYFLEHSGATVSVQSLSHVRLFGTS